MGLFRRKPADPRDADARDAFRRVAAELDSAQRLLLAAVPTARDAGVPLAGAVDAFAAGLDRVDALMPLWRTPKTEAAWMRCAEALRASRAEAERLQTSDVSLGFEALNTRLGDVISPLEEFADAASELRRLR